jgi:8-oxo-dGTP pyrophosphatase MutT (NUDIX family)
MAVLKTATGDLILQQRDHGLPGAAHLRGKQSYFGGHVEPGETSAECLIRELQEELELIVQPTQLRLLGHYRKQLPLHGDNNFVDAFEITHPIDPAKLHVHEGAGYVLVNKSSDLSDLAQFSKVLIESVLDLSESIDLFRVEPS